MILSKRKVLLKIVSENRFSGKTYFHTIASREAAAGGMVKELAARGTRLKLDIEAGSPLLILPMSSNSPDIVAVDLGSLTICNKFLFSGDEGTISSVSLSSAEAGDVLGSRRSRAMSGSSRSSVRSRSSAKSPVSVRSGGRRMRMGRGPGSGRTHKSQLQRCASDRAWKFRNVLFPDLQILLRQ